MNGQIYAPVPERSVQIE